jgi:hypothetical protein
MSSIPVIVGGATKETKPSVIIGGAEKKIYDGYVIVGGVAKSIYKSIIQWVYTLDKIDPANRISYFYPTSTNAIYVLYDKGEARAQASVNYTLSETIHLPANAAITVKYFMPSDTYAHIRINGTSDSNEIWRISGTNSSGTATINLSADTDLSNLYIQVESFSSYVSAYVDVTLHPTDTDSFNLNDSGSYEI